MFFPNKENNNIFYISETLNLIFGPLLSLFFFLLGIHSGIKTLVNASLLRLKFTALRLVETLWLVEIFASKCLNFK